MPSTNEAFARVKIDALLMAQGWNVQDTNAVRFEVVMPRSEEHTSELQSHSEISYAVFCLKKKK